MNPPRLRSKHNKMTTTPELRPSDESQGPEARSAMALRFLDHADQEWAKGNRLQATEKAWAGVAQQFKAITEQRGWVHESHYFRDMAKYLDKEFETPGTVAAG